MIYQRDGNLNWVLLYYEISYFKYLFNQITGSYNRYVHCINIIKVL